MPFECDYEKYLSIIAVFLFGLLVGMVLGAVYF